MIGLVLFWFIVLSNLGGAAYGFVLYYGEQLLSTNPLLWLFVPDCPLYALLFALAFLARGNPRPRIVERVTGRSLDVSFVWFLGFLGAMKYGFWTVFVLSAYSGFYFTPASGFMYSVLFVAHLFLLFETILLVGRIRVRKWFLPAGIVWFLANDLSDYLLGTHPPLPGDALGFMFPATVGMTIMFSLLSYRVLSLKYGRGS
jgi:uncharacterized membrane protein YpjA